MTVTLTIPAWFFWALAGYFVTGLVLFVPLNHWAHRFISPRLRGRAIWRHVRPGRFLVGNLACGVLWPGFVGDNLRNEWRYGVGRRFHAQRKASSAH